MATSIEECVVLVAGDDDAGERLDKFIARNIDDLSRSRIATLIRDGQIAGPAGTIVEPSYRVKPAERFQLDLPAAVDAAPRGESIALSILHEDDDLIVIDKPAGLVVHPGAGNPTGTLVNALIAHCGDSLSGIGGVKRPGIVHRLDKDTSGVMVAAKNDRAHRALAKQFADHGRKSVLRRAYLALIWGAPQRQTGVIDRPIGRHKTERIRQAVVAEGHGRAARTRYQVVETYPAGSTDPIAALVRCELETGRTHQVRVHLAWLGTPIIADPLYARGFRTKQAKLTEPARELLGKLDRQCLHAAELSFAHPRDGRLMAYSAPLPTEMATLAVKLMKS